jgi:hypothetical protein
MEPSRFACDGLLVGDIIVSEICKEVPESLIVRYFGKKSSKSGWKYNILPMLAEQEAILDLYCRVYDTNDIPNKEISVSFAKGLILMSLGKSVNWAQFSEERQKIRESLRKKAEVRKEKREREVDDGLPKAPSTLGKKRFSADRVGVGFPTTFSLTVKSDVDADQGFVMAKKGSSSKSGHSGVLPDWAGKDVEGMMCAIESNEVLLEECRECMRASSEEVILIEDWLWRAKLLLSDRQMMVTDNKAKLSLLREHHREVQICVEGKTLSLAELELLDDSREGCEVLRVEVSAGNAKVKSLSL